MEKKVKPLSMESDTFADLKKDMTSALNTMVETMQECGVDKAAMTVKLVVTLEDKELDEGKSKTCPKIEHRVSYITQVKNEKKGELAGDYTLEGDGKGGFVLRVLTDQLQMFEGES